MLHEAKGKKHLDKVRKVMKSAGYSTGGQNHSMKKIAKKAADTAVHEHEHEKHPDEKMTKLKTGGIAEGKKAHARLDKHTRGGKTKGGSHVHVNVIVPQAKKEQPPVLPGAMGAAGAPPMPPKPPMAPPAGGPLPMGGGMPGNAMPMGGAPMKPPGMKTGGATKANVGSKLTAGNNGIGRMEKENKYGDDFPKKKSGGEIKPKSIVEGKEISSKNGRVNVD